MIKAKLPLYRKKRRLLKRGQRLLLCGKLYTARDMAHKRLIEMIRERRSLPISLRDQTLYYCGPTPPPPGKAIGSCGPTTSSRMDPFTIPLLKKGLGVMIGKGGRSPDIRAAIKRYKGVYLIATGGTGALLSAKVNKASLAAFGDLGPEAIYELEVEGFPVIVAIDSKGRDIYDKK